MSQFQKFWAPIASIVGAVLLALQLTQAFTGNRTLFTGLLILFSLIAIGAGMWNYAFAPSVIKGFPRYQYHWIAKFILFFILVAILVSATYILTILDVVSDCCGFVSTNTTTPTPQASTTPTLTNAPTIAITETLTNTPLPLHTEVPVSPQPPPPSITELVDAKGVQMELVPAGEFTMGSNTGDPDERPASTIYFGNFYIDRFEVTNAFYKACVDVGSCDPPVHVRSNTHTTYYGVSEFNNYPVIYVNWFMAKMYCEWRGARLPTEAEWEKAARGADGRTYPWGDRIDKTYANYDRNQGDTTTVGSYEIGKSFYGVYDMAGNVWEWVSSLYKPYPYNSTDGRENLNVKDSRVLRGGSWYYGPNRVTTYFRSFSNPIDSGNNVGFRCAKSAS